MEKFAKYYIEFLRALFNNIGDFFKGLWETFSNAFFNDIVEYFQILINHWSGFTFIDWLFEIIAIIINVGFFGFLGLRAFQLIKRYVKFARKEIEKDALLEEIASLNLKTAELVDEKNKIMAMKVSQLTGTKFEEEKITKDDKEKKAEVKGPKRFSKLDAVDKKYELELSAVLMDNDDMVNLPELVDRFINFSASQLGLFYDHKTIRTYFAGLATSKIIILEGISGTGKTSLPYAMGRFFKNHAAICSVQPSWRDRAEMIGYLNEFTKKFNETDFLKSLYETLYREDMNFIVLDEMNLARIEYYFAEFLSIMEMPNVNDWKIDIVPDVWNTDPKHLVDGKILVPQNVWFVGTANRDDSTFTITDKVYDRATSIEMNHRADYIDAPYTEAINMTYEYFSALCKKGQEANPISSKNLEKLNKVDDFISDKFKITFGNRILKQIKLFVPAFVACGGDEVEGLDYIVFRKIFRKFETLNIAFLKEEIGQLISLLDRLFGKGAFSSSIAYLNELLRNS